VGVVRIEKILAYTSDTELVYTRDDMGKCRRPCVDVNKNGHICRIVGSMELDSKGFSVCNSLTI